MALQDRAASRLSSSFRLLWGSAAMSNLGDGIGMVALPLLAAGLTRDPLEIAVVAAAQRLPWLVFVLISRVIPVVSAA
jgi:hypothetical protein